MKSVICLFYLSLYPININTYVQDQLRRVRKQQELLRARGMADGGAPLRDASGRLLPINRLPGSGPVPTSSRRRHKPSSNILKMRCGACGQTGTSSQFTSFLSSSVNFVPLVPSFILFLCVITYL